MSSWPGMSSLQELGKRSLADLSGLLYLCMDDCRAIKSLISSLYVPVPELRVRVSVRIVREESVDGL